MITKPQLLNQGPIQWIPGLTLEDVKIAVIVQAYEFHEGNRTKTAQALGISKRTLYNWLRDLNKGVM